MLWLLLGACGYLFSVGYDVWIDDRTELKPLDPIDAHLACGLKIDELLAYGIRQRWRPAIRVRKSRKKKMW